MSIGSSTSFDILWRDKGFINVINRGLIRSFFAFLLFNVVLSTIGGEGNMAMVFLKEIIDYLFKEQVISLLIIVRIFTTSYKVVFQNIAHKFALFVVACEQIVKNIYWRIHFNRPNASVCIGSH